MAVERINPESLFNYPALSHVVIAPSGRLAFIAGQTALDRQFKLASGDALIEISAVAAIPQ